MRLWSFFLSYYYSSALSSLCYATQWEQCLLINRNQFLRSSTHSWWLAVCDAFIFGFFSAYFKKRLSCVSHPVERVQVMAIGPWLGGIYTHWEIGNTLILVFDVSRNEQKHFTIIDGSALCSLWGTNWTFVNNVMLWLAVLVKPNYSEFLFFRVFLPWSKNGPGLSPRRADP